jgi:hypothetical protein
LCFFLYALSIQKSAVGYFRSKKRSGVRNCRASGTGRKLVFYGTGRKSAFFNHGPESGGFDPPAEKRRISRAAFPA